MLYRRFASPSLARREWPEDDSTTNEADCFVLCCCAAAAVVDSFAGLNVEKVDTPPRYEELAKSSEKAFEGKKKRERETGKKTRRISDEDEQVGNAYQCAFEIFIYCFSS